MIPSTMLFVLVFFSQTLKDVYSNARGNKNCNYNQRLETHFGNSLPLEILISIDANKDFEQNILCVCKTIVV
jgi:hypothetical protein